MAATSLEHLDSKLPEMLGSLHDNLTVAQTDLTGPVASSGSTPSLHAASPSTSGTWSELFAPKLTATTVTELKKRFKANYPAEILLPETMPSLRLLSYVHHQKTKGEFSWVPWKFRISQLKADDINQHKSSRIPKSEGLQLHSLLLDSFQSWTFPTGLWVYMLCVKHLRHGAMRWPWSNWRT